MPNIITTTSTLTGTTLITALGGMKLPVTITLKSADVTRKIELSTDGVEYFSPIIDISSPTMLVTTLNAPVVNIRVTGVVSDKLVMVS